MSVPPIITRIFTVVEQLLTANVDSNYLYQQIGDVRGLISERRFKNALEVLRTLEDELTDIDAYKLLEHLLLRVVEVQEKVHEEKVHEEKIPETSVPETTVPETTVPETTIVKEGTVYRVTLTNINSIHRKHKKMRKTYKLLDEGPKIWSLLNIGTVYYTFDTKGSIDSVGSNVAIEDVELKQVVMAPVPEPEELLDGMLIQVKWKGYPVMTQMYRNVVYAESPVVFVTYNTKTPIITTPFDPDDPGEDWSYPTYLNLTSEARIEVLDCGQYLTETKPLLPDKGAQVNVCVAALSSGEMRVLLPDEFSNGDKSRSFDAVAIEAEILRTDYVECKVTKVGRTTCTLERYGEVPLGCILGVWRPVDKGDRYKEPEHTPHLWNCEWVKNKKKFVLDVYYTEVRLSSTGSYDTWVKDNIEEEDDDALEQFEEYDYGGVTYICEGESKTTEDDIVYKLTNKKLGKTIFKTAQQIQDQVEAKFELFDAHLKNYVLYDNKLWKIVEFEGSDRTYTLQREEETTIAQERDIAPEPILQYEVGQLVGYKYEFCKIFEVELVYELTRLDQKQDPRTPEANLDETYRNVTEVALDEWCMYKKKVVRLKLSEEGLPVRELKSDKKGVMISHVKIFDTPKAKRPKTVKESLVAFQADINSMFIHEKWNGLISKNARVNVELKNGKMREGIVVGWRESKKADHATSDSYRIRFDDGIEHWYQYQKIEVLSESSETKVTEESGWSEESSSESESDSDSDSDSVVDDEFDDKFVWVQEPQPLGFAGEQVRYDDGFESDDEDDGKKVWSIVKDVSAEDLGQKKLNTEQLNMFVIGDGSEQKTVYLDDLTKVIVELDGIALLDGEVFKAEVLESGNYKVASCWRTLQLVVPPMCLIHYVPVPGVGNPVYLLEDDTYQKRIVKSTQKGMYQLDTGENVNRTQLDPYVEPFKIDDTVHLKGSCYEIYKVTKTQGRKVDLESTWDTSKKIMGVDMSNARHSSDEYEKGDFVRIKATGNVMKVSKSVNNRVSVDGISGITFSPSELAPAADPSTQISDMEDSSDEDN